MPSFDEMDEFAENSIDAIPEPSIEELLATATMIGNLVAEGKRPEDFIPSTHDPITGTPVADLHPNGHMFNRVNGVNFCACDCENCNGPIPAGKHWPTCICVECECDG